MSLVMDKSPTVVKSWRSPWGRVLGLIGVGVLALVLGWRLGWVDPSVGAVLALEGDHARGQAIFQANCAVCHGVAGDGNIGPSLLGVAQRRSKVHLIEQVTSGKTPPMPQFQPNAQEMADLLTYLETL